MKKLSDDLRYWRAERPDEWKMDEFIRRAVELEDFILEREVRLSELITKTSYAEQVKVLGFSREVLHRLAKRGAIVLDGVVYAPVKKRLVGVVKHKN